jgi:hypothetical protein
MSIAEIADEINKKHVSGRQETGERLQNCVLYKENGG